MSLHVREARFLTAVAVVFICVVLIERGQEIVRYFLTERTAARGAEGVQALQPWTATTGLAFAAFEGQLRRLPRAEDQAALDQLTDIVTNMLSLRPLSSSYWLSLSTLLAARGAPDQAARMLAMSALTGPNEGAVMGPRGIAGVDLWESLLPAMRQQAASDLAGIKKVAPVSLTPIQQSQLAFALLKKPENIREKMVSDLVATGALSANEITQYGLAPAATGQ